jgi:hypothetical protein
MAMAGRTQDRCRGACRVMGTDDTADHHGRQVRSSTVTSREIPKRDGTGQGRRLIPSWRWRRGERVPWPAAQIAFRGPGGPPLWSARAGLLDPVARNRIRFIEIAFRLRQNASNIPTHETAPCGWIDGYLRRICNRGCRRRVLETLMRPAVAYPKAMIASAIPLGKDRR